MNDENQAAEEDIIGGPWGFGEANALLGSVSKKCLVKSAFDHPGDKCIHNPGFCDNGISFSIWEKVSYPEEVLDVRRPHEKQYIFSTGGDYSYDNNKAYPGLALYHEGLNLVAVVR